MFVLSCCCCFFLYFADKSPKASTFNVQISKIARHRIAITKTTTETKTKNQNTKTKKKFILWFVIFGN